jgi:peptide-methionine (R)-S-oxide reductase
MTASTLKPNSERDAEWRSRLTALQYHVTREAGTEMPNTGIYNMEERDGCYNCLCCGHILFTSGMKYKSGCGWPAFYEALPESVQETKDKGHGMKRTEITCSKCDGHLGHVFNDGPNPTGLRYCINSVSMDFEPSDKE